MKRLFGLALIAGSVLAGCATPSPIIDATELPSLPEASSNNAVAAVSANDGTTLFSFLGLGGGKTWRDVHNHAAMLAPGAVEWAALPDVPGPGRLAATAVTVNGEVYIFGGYTVAEDGGEVSDPSVLAFNPSTGRYSTRQPMPVPVDDALSVVYLDRFVYLISGWHDLGNVNLVQVFDTVNNVWQQATPFPGRPVFGHAGGLAADTLVVCGGVAVRTTSGKRQFDAERTCLSGTIDASDWRRIDWRTMAHPPGPARYRAAAAAHGDQVIFVGGSANPYNYNGIGYNGDPSEPLDDVHAYNVRTQRWSTLGQLAVATMDHRGLPVLADGRFVIIGGMRPGQHVSDGVRAFRIQLP